MYRPSRLNFTSEMDEIISEKNERVVGSSSSSKPRMGVSTSGNYSRSDKHFAERSQRAESRISASLMLLFELEYMNKLHCVGWNSVAVMTSVSSSIFTGLISTMSVKTIISL